MIDFISIDIEADGPIPGRNSMLSFGAAAFSLTNKVPESTFTATLELLPEATPDPETMDWWKTEPQAWEIARNNPRPASQVMREFITWYSSLTGKPPLAGFPVTYDFMFLYWYTMAFGGLPPGKPCPFGFQGWDIKTEARAKLGVPFREVSKRRMPQTWFQETPRHTHTALEDAIEQGVLLINILTS